MEQQISNKLSGRKVVVLALAAIGVIVSPFVIMGAVEDLDAKEIMVIQYPTGQLAAFTEQGPKFQWWGKVTKYPRRDQYSFSSSKDQGFGGDQSVRIGFNDGGEGKVSGVMSWEMPLKEDQIITLHKDYNGFEAIEQQLIRPMLEKVIFGTGATMSSFESNSERKSEIPQTIDDQMQNGPFLTKVVVTNIKDPVTKEEKTVRAVQVATDEKTGKPIRSSSSTVREYGIGLSPVTVNHIEYESKVKEQIAERQKSTQAVQLSMASAIRATQDAVTTEQQGRADAAKAKWAQETVNAKDISAAERDLKVASLATQTAEQYKRKMILEGEGEATKKKLILEADGALEPKLAAWTKAQGYWAEAYKNATQPMVPQIQMGGNGESKTGVDSAQQMMQFLSVKAAKDLGLDLHMTSGAQAKK